MDATDPPDQLHPEWARHPSAGGRGHLAAVPPTEPAEQPTFVKLPPPFDPDRRRSEAAVLQALGHPGTVEVRDVKEGSQGAELILTKVDASDLLHRSSLTAEEIVDVFGQVCQTIGEIHAAGFAHGNLGAEHILVTDDGRAVLCGFGNSAPVRCEARPDGLDPALDITAIARLLDREIERCNTEHDDDRLLSGLRHIASVADAHEVTKATAGSLALRLHQLSNSQPHATAATRPPDSSESGDTEVLRRVEALGARLRNSSLAGFLAVGLCAAVAIVGVAMLTGDQQTEVDETDSTTATTPGEPSASTTETPTPDPTAELVMAIEPDCPPLSSSSNQADIDGDGCLETWRITGSSIEAGSQRYSIGNDASVVAVADWDCDGDATPALVDAAGNVFVFDSWPNDDQSETVKAVGNVAGADSISTPNCGEIQVESADGSSRAFATGSAEPGGTR